MDRVYLRLQSARAALRVFWDLMERGWGLKRPLGMERTSTRAGWVIELQPQSFEEFYRRSWSDVYRPLALTLRDPDLACESTDEAMARAFKHWRSVRTASNPTGWVYRVALNWAIDRKRKLQKEILRTPPERGVWMPQVVDVDLFEHLSSLSVPQRAVVVLRVLHDWSEADTAEALGVPVGTVKSRLNRALSALARRMSDDD